MIRRLSFCEFVLVALLVSTMASGPIIGQSVRSGSAPGRVSITGAGRSHTPVVSADGSHVAFVSQANNLVTNDDLGPYLDLFVRNLAASDTVLVSLSTNGVGGANDNIVLYGLSSNAQLVAFETAANNLSPGDTNRHADIYVRDIAAGTTTLVSVNAEGGAAGNGPSINPLLSEDGRYVIFESLASNLVTNDFNGTNDIFIRDLATGITRLVSVNGNGIDSPSGPSFSPSISANGLFVAFVSRATNLVDGVTNRAGEIYVRDVAAGSNRWAGAAHLAGTHSRTPASGVLETYVASQPVLSADGRYVAFKTLGQTVRFDLLRSTNSVYLAFTNDTNPNPSVNYFRFDDNPQLSLSAGAGPLAFTPDGRFLAYATRTNVVPYAGFVRIDFESFSTNVIQDVANGSMGGPSFTTNKGPGGEMVVTNFNSPDEQALWVGINTNGERLFFLSDAKSLVPGATNGTFQLYAVDVGDRAVQLLSINQSALPGADLGGATPDISRDGALVVWDSPDALTVTNDWNRTWDVFAKNLSGGDTRLLSSCSDGRLATTANAPTGLGPSSLSADGRFLAFIGLDDYLVGSDTNLLTDVLVRDLQTGDVLAAGFPMMSDPFGTATAGIPARQTSLPIISGDGRRVVYHARQSLYYYSPTNVFLFDRTTGSNYLVNSLVSGGDGSGGSFPSITSDGRLVAFQSVVSAPLFDSAGPADANGTWDVFLRNFGASNSPIQTISLTPAGTNTGSDASILPVVSPDARWLSFLSKATDLVAGSFPAGTFQVYVRDLVRDQTRLVSFLEANEMNVVAMVASSTNPVFSANARFIVFGASSGNRSRIFRHDLAAPLDGIYTNDLVCVDCATPSVSADGRFVAYQSWPAGGGITNIVVRDLESGQSELMSVNRFGGVGGNGSSFTPMVSHDVRYVVFSSKASDLVSNDNNGVMDVFVRDRLNRVTHCLSRNRDGSGTGNRVSSRPILSADGRTVAFQSFAGDLVAGDYNDTRDVFVATLGGPDSDGDGMDDDWEMAYFSSLSRDGSGDFDGDGASDLSEFRAGTNPSKDASVLRVITLTTFANQPNGGQRTTTIIWAAIPGRNYRVQSKEVVDEDWIDLPGDVLAVGVSASKVHMTENVTGQRFYRVVAVP